MKISVSGDGTFLTRYAGLSRALQSYFSYVEVVPSGNLAELMPVRVVGRLTRGTILEKSFTSYLGSLDRRPFGYEVRSRQTERKLTQSKPGFVIHVFSSFGPYWSNWDTPYAMYLDFTMALARSEWTPWAQFKSEEDLHKWMKHERRSYENARVLFTMGSNCRESLVKDYGIAAHKIHVVGSGGNFRHPYEGAKSFGSKQILFQGSEFQRKGGDIVLEAFRHILKMIPDAQLIIVGSDLEIQAPGVVNLGYVRSRERMEELFLTSDLVIAPARCDPFTAFVIEAMNYGVPSVVTAASGIASALENGANAVIVDSLNPLDVAEAALGLLGDADLLNRISIGGRSAVKNVFNWDSIGRQMYDRINESIGG